MARISGPLLDRLDLHVEVPRIQYEQLHDQNQYEKSSSIRQRVMKARQIQEERFAGTNINVNSQMGPKLVKAFCPLDRESKQMLKYAFDKFSFSARAYDRILKVSRTIADLEDLDKIESQHLAEAIQYRSLERKYWHNI
jgi:magnesium chelatase family protein